MRNTFIRALQAEAEKDPRIILLTGDLGYSVFEEFSSKHPQRFINVGVSEQNMIGVAAGLSLCGFKSVAYSIATFASMRPFEQIRIDVAFQRADVLIVGVGAGVAYGTYGPTHQATEDVALMRSLPNMVVLCPADPVEAELATIAALRHRGPVYLRLGKGKEPVVHEKPFEFVIGKSVRLSEGDDLTLFSTGDGLHVAKAAAGILREQGLSVRLVSMPCVKPIDREAIIAAGRETKHVFTLEEHNLYGGLGSAVAEVLAGMESHAPLTTLAIPDQFFDYAGSQQFLRSAVGLDAPSVARRIKQALRLEPVADPAR